MIQLISVEPMQGAAPAREGQGLLPARDVRPASISGARSEGDFIAQLTDSLLQAGAGSLDETLQAALAAVEQQSALAEQELAEEAELAGQAAEALPVSAEPAEQAGSVLGLPGVPADAAAGTAEGADALPAERWLRGMQNQQQAVVAARDSGSLQPQAALVQRSATAQPTAQDVSGHAGIEQLGVDEVTQQTAGIPNGQVREGAPASSAAAVTVLAAASDSAAATSMDTQAAAQRGQAAPSATLQLHAPEAKWGEQMLHALRNHVQLQLQQQSQHAIIRLDPPELGSLDLQLSHESGRLTVQITAVNSDVARLLQQTSERLRQELVGQNFLQVDVQVFSEGQQGGREHARQYQPRFTDELPAVAAAVADTAAERQAAGRDSDLLVTV